MVKYALYILIGLFSLASCHSGFHFEKRKYRSGWYRGGNVVESEPIVKQERETKLHSSPKAAKVEAAQPMNDTLIAAPTMPALKKKECTTIRNSNRVKLNKVEQTSQKMYTAVRSAKKIVKKSKTRTHDRGDGFVLVLKILLVLVIVVVALLLAIALVSAASDPLALLVLLILFVPVILGLALLMGIILSM